MMKNFRMRADSDVKKGSNTIKSIRTSSSSSDVYSMAQSRRGQNLLEESVQMREEGRSPSQDDGQTSPSSSRRGLYFEEENIRDSTKTSPTMSGPSQQDAFGGLHLLLAAAEQSLGLPCLDDKENKTNKKSNKARVLPPYAISEDQDDKIPERHFSSLARATAIPSVSPDAIESPTSDTKVKPDSIASAMLKAEPKSKSQNIQAAASNSAKLEKVKTKSASPKKNSKTRVMPPDSDTSTYAARRRRAGSKRPSEHRAEKEKQEQLLKLRKLQEEKEKKQPAPPLICLLNSDSGSNDESDGHEKSEITTEESGVNTMEEVRSCDPRVRYLKCGSFLEEREEVYNREPVFRSPYPYRPSSGHDQGQREQLPHHPTPSHSPGNRRPMVLTAPALRSGAEEIKKSPYSSSSRRILHVYPPPQYLQDLSLPMDPSASRTIKPVYHVPFVTEHRVPSQLQEPNSGSSSRHHPYPYYQVIDGRHSVLQSRSGSPIYDERQQMHRHGEHLEDRQMKQERRDGHAGEIWRRAPIPHHPSAAAPVTPGYHEFAVVRNGHPQSVRVAPTFPVPGEIYHQASADGHIPMMSSDLEGRPAHYKPVTMVLIPHQNRSHPTYPPTSERHFAPGRNNAHSP